MKKRAAVVAVKEQLDEALGERHWISGSTPLENWEASLRRESIAETVINGLREHFGLERSKRIALVTEEGSATNDAD